MSPTTRFVAGIAALMAAAISHGPTVRAQTAQQFDWCNGKGNPTADMIVSGCTAVIQSGAFTDKNMAKAFVLRGRALGEKGDADHAIADYDQAIRLDPTSARAFSERGLQYTRKNEYERALADFAQSIKLEPASEIPWAFQGDTYYSMGKLDQAIASFGEAIDRAADWMWPYNDRGELYLDAGKYDLAISDFDQVIRVGKTYAIGWNNRCRAYAILGRLEEALNDCNEALKIDPTFTNEMVKSGKVSTIQDRGLVHLKAGRLQLAIEDYDKAFALLPKSAEVLFGRGVAKEKSGDRVGGEADMASAGTIEPGIAERFASFGVK